MSNEKARRITITVRGDTEDALAQALAEATRRINEGSLSGSGQSDDGGFYFDSTDDVPEGQRPA